MKIFCYQRNIELWRRKTAKLSLQQRGIYSELIDWYYCTGGDMPSDIDELCRMIGATKRNERENLISIISNQDLFTIQGAKLVQKMCDETLSFIAQKSAKAAVSARSKHNKNNDLNGANAQRSDSERSANYKLLTINHKLASNEHEKNGKEKKVFDHDEVNKAKKDSPAWTPDLISCQTLPGGWGDFAEQKGVPESQIYKSWGRFKDACGEYPFELARWLSWVGNERVGGRVVADGEKNAPAAT